MLRFQKNILNDDISGDEKGLQVKDLLAQTQFERGIIASLTDKEFIRISEALRRIKKTYYDNKNGFICTLPFKRIVQMATRERSEGLMKISEYLEIKFICTELESQTKEEAINELAGLVKDCPEVVDFDQFIKDIFDREGMMSTGIGNNIAVPHARTDAVSKLIIAMGRSKSGIDFKSIDGQPVQLIFLMGTPTKDMSNYLRVLAYLTRVLIKEDFRRQLLEAEDAAAIIDIFSSKENHTVANG